MIVVVEFSESFSRVLTELAAEFGLHLLHAASPDGADLARASAIVIAAAGAEQEVPGRIAEIRAVTDAPVVAIGTARELPVVIAIVRAGASDYFALPPDIERLRSWLEEMARRVQSLAAAATLAQQQRASYDFSRMVGDSAELRAALERAARIIPHADATVLITGETGTGKELLAQAIHYNGPRAARPIVEVNCTALPATLLEAELFGYEKGAFTGATAAKPGLFEAAHGGTLFLDEIGDLTLDLQAKILRALEARQIRRLGSVRATDINVRIIAATHVELTEAIQDGRFREDLYYRLSVVPIHLPALRERGNDVVLLANYFIQHFNELYQLQAARVDDDMRAALLAYAWPGNIRELRNAVERSLLLSDGIPAIDELIPRHASRPRATPSPIAFPARMEEIETQAALAMVQHCAGNKTAAAAALGISRARLYRLLGEVAE